jgi:ribosomal protein L7/L12
MRWIPGTINPNASKDLLTAMPEVIAHVRANAKIQAIKALRTVTNCGLKEGKDAVERPIQEYIDRGGV